MSTNNSSFRFNGDAVVFVDQSGSMGDPVGAGYPNPKQIRWDAVKESTEAFAQELESRDPDGITVVYFNNTYKIEDGVTAENVKNVFGTRRPNNGTYLAEPLKAIIDKFLPTTYETKKTGGMFSKSVSVPKKVKPAKPVFICIFTDGAASDEAEVIKVIVDATKRIEDRSHLGILFVQVANDPNATAFLDRLNNNLGPNGAEHDIVAVTKLEDLEDYTTDETIALAFTA